MDVFVNASLSRLFFFCWPPVAVNILYFLVHTIDGLGGGAIVETLLCTIAAFSLYGEYVVRSFLPNCVFLPCDHGLDFLHQLV